MFKGFPKPRSSDGTLRFGLMWQSSPTPTVTSAAVADLNPDPLDVREQAALAQAAERAGVDYVFLADGYIPHGANSRRIGHAEPQVSAPIWAPIIMAATEHLGVVSTFHTRYLPPAVIARQGANLDVLSNGRWAWNIVPGVKTDECALLGVDADLAHDVRYEITYEAVDAVKALWAARGEKVDFHGEYFDLHGTMLSPFPVQEPWPCLFNAGVSSAGKELIARTCDYAFTPLTDDLAAVRATVDDIAARTEAHGRPARDVNLAGAVGVVLADTDAEAHDRYEWMRETLDLPGARDIAMELMGYSETYSTTYSGEFDEVARTLGVSCGSQMIIGSPETAAERLLQVHREAGVRGFMFLATSYTPRDIELIGEVLPHLQKAGVWTPPAERGWSW